MHGFFRSCADEGIEADAYKHEKDDDEHGAIGMLFWRRCNPLLMESMQTAAPAAALLQALQAGNGLKSQAIAPQWNSGSAG